MFTRDGRADPRPPLHRQGLIANGYLADLVLLDADPLADIRNTRKVHAVAAGGRLFPKEVVEKLAEGAKP